MSTGTKPLLLLFSAWGRRPPPRPRRTVAAAGLALVVFGCTPSGMEESPLVDPWQPPTVLVEGRHLRLPNTGPGNRFVSGWLFEEHDPGWTVAPAGADTRLEIVQLADRPRTLTLTSAAVASGPAPSAGIGDRRLTVRSTESGFEIDLPQDLPHGRNLVDLHFSGNVGARFSGARASAVVRPGRIAIDDHDIVQHPWSVLEFVRWVEPGTTLEGDFVPPVDVGTNARFAVELETADGSRRIAFAWRASDGTASFRAPLRSSRGFVRIRLVADGDGAAGRWRGLRLRWRGRVPSQTNRAIPDPPRVVVLYVLDAMRADVIGHLGSTGDVTPCLDRLASEGVTFTSHFSLAPNTGPSTATLFTGYGFLRARAIPKAVARTLAGDFGGAGYRTVSISSNPHLSPSYGLTRGFDDVIFEPIDEDFDRGADDVSTVNDSAERLHDAALHWLDGVPPGDRVFLYLHTLNPHNPYTPPEPYPSRFLESDFSTIDGGTRTLAAIRDLELDVDTADEQRIREWYTSGIAYNDAALCGFIEELDRRFGDDVLLAVTSDHGEELFDHDGVLHGYTLYDELLHIPLVVRWPGRIRPARINRATDTLDLSEGLRALVSPGRRRGGRDALWAAFTDGDPVTRAPSVQFATAPGLRRAAMARSEGWKLILTPRPRFDWGMGRGRGRTREAEYVFDLGEDPAEMANRAGASNLEIDWLRSRLRGWVDYWETRQPEADDESLDETTRRRLEALGYGD